MRNICKLVPEIECGSCDSKFFFEFDRLLHIRIEHKCSKDENGRYSCSDCDSKPLKLKKIRPHVVTHLVAEGHSEYVVRTIFVLFSDHKFFDDF